MYKTLTIGGHDYKLEYTIEASLYADCVKGTAELFSSLALASDEKDVSKIIAGVSNIPQTTLTVFLQVIFANILVMKLEISTEFLNFALNRWRKMIFSI